MQLPNGGNEVLLLLLLHLGVHVRMQAIHPGYSSSLGRQSIHPICR
jgi:hypothetical protein